MITKNYIKMCEKNEDLQKQWLPIIPDLCIRNHKIRWLLRFTKDIFEIDKNIDKWLPTQEQLQEMVLKDIDDLEVSFTNKDISAIEANIWLKKDGKWDSFEPLFADNWNTLWLQIYMLMKYSKTWTGETWEVAK